MKTLTLVIWFSGFSADAVSTQYALANGAREVMLSPNAKVNALIIAGQASAGAWTLAQIHKEHPKLAYTLGIAAGIFKVSLAARNVWVAGEMKRQR